MLRYCSNLSESQNAFCLLFRGKWHTHELLLAAKLSQKCYPSTNKSKNFSLILMFYLEYRIDKMIITNNFIILNIT